MSTTQDDDEARAQQALANAFAPDFLQFLLDLDDEAPGIDEALYAGDWEVYEMADGRFGVFHGWQRPPHGEPPGGVFEERWLALLAAALLPTLGRENTFHFGTEGAEPGMPLVAWNERSRGLAAVGALPTYNAELRNGLEMAARLSRLPRSIALLLEAAGTETIREVGEILSVRMLGRAGGAEAADRSEAG